MITWRVKGDGTEDFTSIVNAVTAIPSIALTDDYKIEVYLNTGGSRVYNEYITRGALITNGFTVEIVGMVGSVDVLDSQIVVNNAGSYVWNISGIFYGQYGCILSNFECNDATYCVCVERARPALVRNMRIHGNVANGIYRSRYGIVIDSCIIDTTSVAINTYAGVTALNCLLRAPNALCGTSTGFIKLYGCSIYATGWTSFGSLGYLIFNRCIYVSSGDLLPKLSFINDELMRSTYLSLWRNSILYSTSLGVGYLNTVDSFDDYFGVFVDEIDNWDIKNFDPEFNETGGIEEYLTLKSNSLALPENQTARNNLLYTGHKITPSDIGAYTNYEAPDFPSVEDVLTRATTNNVQGEYVPADIANHLAPNAFGYNGEFTGTLTVTAPNPASLVSATAGDGQVSISVTAPNTTDTVYARYRIAGTNDAWSTESVTFSRTGSGAIVITGLINGKAYEFIVYVNNGGCASEWSIVLVAIPVSSTGLGGSIMGQYLASIKLACETSSIFEWVGYSLDDIPTAVNPSCVIVPDEDPEPTGEETNSSVAKVFTFRLLIDIRSKQKPTEEIMLIREQISTILRNYSFSVTGHYDTDLESGQIEEQDRQAGLFGHRSVLVLKCYARVSR